MRHFISTSYQFSGFLDGYLKIHKRALKTVLFHLDINNVMICEAPASVFREDLKNSGIGDGACGFNVEPNWQVFEEGENVVVMYVNDVPVHAFNLTVTNKQLMVAMTSQIHRQIELAKAEIIESIHS